MSDTKLRPEDLTIEEIHAATTKILADPLLHRFYNWSISGCRALFAPAPGTEKARLLGCICMLQLSTTRDPCSNRNRPDGNPPLLWTRDGCPLHGKPAPSEAEDEFISDGFTSACAAIASSPKPAQPKPAAPEMPTIRPYTAKDIRAWIAARGYLSVEQHNDFGRVLPTSNMGACMEALAEALEEIERNLAQPVRLEKVRAYLEAKGHPISKALIDALAELDAAEGKGEGRG